MLCTPQKEPRGRSASSPDAAAPRCNPRPNEPTFDDVDLFRFLELTVPCAEVTAARDADLVGAVGDVHLLDDGELRLRLRSVATLRFFGKRPVDRTL